jgi:two-component system, cell cycle sensor histidine kinase and response regulator CckA
VESEPERGTKFRVFFPASDGKAHAPDRVDDRLQGGNGTEKILLVEDEPSVRSAAAKLLVVHGYEVVTACTGGDALKLWREHCDTIALLVTDLAMPGGVNGRELALQLLVERPDLKVLFTSGYSAELVDGQLDLSPGQRFLHKPFHPKQLLEAIRQCLDT